MSLAKPLVAAAFAVALGAALVLAVLPELSPPSAPAVPTWIGESLWVARGLDTTIQSFLLLAGVLTIVLLLRASPGGERRG